MTPVPQPRKAAIALVVPLSGAMLALLSACSTPGQSPSLARRPAELAGRPAPCRCPEADAQCAERIGSAPVVPAVPGPVAVQQPAPEVPAERLAQLQASAREAHARFAGKRARAATLVAAARGAPMASEAWSVATIAIAELESARSDAMIALGELDRIYAATRIDGGDGQAIAAVRDQVTAWVADEDAVLADLARQIRG